MTNPALPNSAMLAILLALAGSLPVGAQPASPQVGSGVAAAAAAPDQGYVLGPQDVVEVDVFGQADFKVRAPIGADGSIELPYIGKVAAANKTTIQLGGDIASALEAGGFYSHPIISIQIVAYASRYVTVLGEVGTPGLVPIDRAYHLSDILARVGGVKEDAADFVMVRPADGPERRYLVSDLATGDDAQDPLVSPGDKIFSPRAALFYISGQVKAPGAYPMTTGMTLRMAIGRGGGLTDLGTDRAVKVRGADGKVVSLTLDDQIAAGEVIVVGERLF
jgi:polysaccharide export outer membrane protein